MPDAHALLIVCAGNAVRQPGAMADLPRRDSGPTRLTRLADQHFVDVGSAATPARASAARAATAPSSAGWTS